MLSGSNRTITLKIDVWNDGEEAHEAFVKAKLPPRVYYDSYTTLTDSGAKIECFTSETGKLVVAMYEYGNLRFVKSLKQRFLVFLEVLSTQVSNVYSPIPS